MVHRKQWRSIPHPPSPLAGSQAAFQGRSGCNCRIKRDPFVEYEAAPCVAFAADLLEVAQDAALELQDVFIAGLAHPQGGLFAADAAGAETDHGPSAQLLAM